MGTRLPPSCPPPFPAEREGKGRRGRLPGGPGRGACFPPRRGVAAGRMCRGKFRALPRRGERSGGPGRPRGAAGGVVRGRSRSRGGEGERGLQLPAFPAAAGAEKVGVGGGRKAVRPGHQKWPLSRGGGGRPPASGACPRGLEWDWEPLRRPWVGLGAPPPPVGGIGWGG